MARFIVATLVMWVVVCTSMRARADASLDVRFEGIAQVVEQAISGGELPGCVVAIGSREQLLYTRGFGQRTAEELARFRAQRQQVLLY
jgi:hypothetical protein